VIFYNSLTAADLIAVAMPIQLFICFIVIDYLCQVNVVNGGGTVTLYSRPTQWRTTL